MREAAKSSALKPRKKFGGWGGKRKGAGRKSVLTFSEKREIANGYYERTQQHGLSRVAAIRELATTYGVTPRMVETSLAKFRKQIRENKKLYRYATEGMNEIGPLPGRETEVKKLKPGMYDDDKRALRLVINDNGNRKWFFRFMWQPTRRVSPYREIGRLVTYREKVLGGSEMSLVEARAAADRARRELKSGQNPIDGSWESSALQNLADLQSDRKRAKS